jgi:predicted short-subunit dehydrogenase-like oxidoreductase (DUF2520 family)
VIESVRVIGSGRVGSALAARLRERGVELASDDPDLVLLCVPDRAIAEVASAVEPGPWLAHVSGATPLDALAPPEQIDGAHAACTAETGPALEKAFELARTLGLEPFELADDKRALYHAGAAFASNYLVTLYRLASNLFEAAGAPPAALVPLMTRTIENDFELTGPISRGDWETVTRHLDAIRSDRPHLEPVYRALAEATAL